METPNITHLHEAVEQPDTQPADALSVYCWSCDQDGQETTFYEDHATGAHYILNADETRVAYSPNKRGRYDLSDAIKTYRETTTSREYAQRLTEARQLRKKDTAIHAARKRLAHEAAGDRGPILERILLIAIERNHGTLPELYPTKQGVDLYHVGENASHFFYAGTKDGRVYQYAECPSDLVLFRDLMSPYQDHSSDNDVDTVFWNIYEYLSDEWRYFVDASPASRDTFDHYWESAAPLVRQQIQQAIQLYKDQPYDPNNNSLELALPSTDAWKDPPPIQIAIRNALHDATDQGSFYIGRGGSTLRFQDLLPTNT